MFDFQRVNFCIPRQTTFPLKVLEFFPLKNLLKDSWFGTALDRRYTNQLNESSAFEHSDFLNHVISDNHSQNKILSYFSPLNFFNRLLFCFSGLTSAKNTEPRLSVLKRLSNTKHLFMTKILVKM